MNHEVAIHQVDPTRNCVEGCDRFSPTLGKSSCRCSRVEGWEVDIYINTETLVLPIFEHLKPNAAGPDLRQQASKGKVWLMERVQFFVSMQSQAKCYF